VAAGADDGAAGVTTAGSIRLHGRLVPKPHHIWYISWTSNPPDPAAEQTGTVGLYTGAMLPNTTYYWRASMKTIRQVRQPALWWSFTTLPYICTGPIASDLNEDCQVDFFDYALIADAWAGNLTEIASIRNRLAELQSGTCD